MFSFSQFTDPNYWIQMLWTIPALLISITIHEFAHAFVAVKQGDPTPERAGRLSLNPLDHLDPIGAIALLLFRFGWAKPVPINPYNFKNPKRGIVFTSLAGPLSNIILMIISIGLYVWLFPILNQGLITFFQTLIVMNLALAIFNMIPVPPLDGSRLITVFIPPRYNAVLIFLERYGFLILIGSFLLFPGWPGILIYPALKLIDFIIMRL